MATQRRKKAGSGGVSTRVDDPSPAPPTEGWPSGVEHVVVASRQVLVDRGDVDSSVVACAPGALVKIAPVVRRSEVEAFDGPGRKRALLALGAAAVVLAPSIVADVGRTSSTSSEAEPAELGAREALELQLSKIVGSPEFVESVRTSALDQMARAGL